MCRLFLFISENTKLSLNYLLNDSYNSIKRQSYYIPYLPGIEKNDESKKRNPTEHLDGFGIIFNLKNKNYVKIRSVNPITENTKLDKFLLDKIDKIYSNYILCFIRNNWKTKSKNVSEIQPFYYNNKFFIHNGEFNQHLEIMKNPLKKYINKEILKELDENLDTKIFFALLLTLIGEKKNLSFDDIYQIIIKLIKIFKKIKNKDFDISLNCIFSDLKKNTHFGMRYRTCNKVPPSLYYNLNFNGGISISSEPIDKDPNWKLFQNEILVIINFKYKLFKIDLLI